MNDLMKLIYEDLEFIDITAGIAYISNQCRIIREKLKDIDNHVYKELESVQFLVNDIDRNNIDKMKGVLNMPKSVYARLDILENHINKIPSKYYDAYLK